MTSGTDLIAAERKLQIHHHGYQPEQDLSYTRGQLLDAALSYCGAAINIGHPSALKPPKQWPWAASLFHPSPSPVRNLVKAGALLAAEIDRLITVEQMETKVVCAQPQDVVPEDPAPRPPAPVSFGVPLNPTPVMLSPSITGGQEIFIQGRKVGVTKAVPVSDPNGFPGLSIEGVLLSPDPQSPEPLRIAVEVEELHAWLAEADSGLKPEVEYRPGEDRAMMEEAYEIRGDKLRSLANRIAAILG